MNFNKALDPVKDQIPDTDWNSLTKKRFSLIDMMKSGDIAAGYASIYL